MIIRAAEPGLLAGREAAQLVEEVEDEQNLVLPGGALRLGHGREREPFAVRVQIEAALPWPWQEAPLGPELWLVGTKRVAFLASARMRSSPPCVPAEWGEVYRAQDTRLQRDVAIKVLPDLFATDPERLARFEREAQVLASAASVILVGSRADYGTAHRQPRRRQPRT